MQTAVKFGKRVSKFTFQYTQSPQKYWTMILNLAKLILKRNLRKIFKWSKNKFTLKQVAIGDIPLTHLYNTSQITLQRNHYSKNHLFRKNSFETMYFNEFSRLSSCISNLNMASIGSLFSKVKPSFLVSRMAWGIYKNQSSMWD
jgi:hypothetical protein